MLFNSFSYALFLPAVFLLYWLPLGKFKLSWQNLLLLVASYVFYCSWDWRFAFLIAFTSASSFFTAILIENGKEKSRKFWAALNIIINLCILGFFKYAGFFVDSFMALAGLFGWSLKGPAIHIILPVGISFYTFQALGYTIDVYRGKVTASRNILRFFTFVAFFPQLVAGPIERASRLLPQFDHERRFDYRQAVDGFSLILKGLFLKIVLADRLGVFVDGVYHDPAGASGLAALVAAVFFAFQLYTDFYSYSEIARGSAKLLGMELMLNFRRPYQSGSFKEFWKRWHISLSSWFMDYVYIPLGGNRKGAVRRVFNVFMVFLLSGLWHGASWTFVAWGFCCAFFMVALDKPLSWTARIPGFNQVLVFVLWALSLILFRASTFGNAAQVFSALGFGNPGAVFSFGLGRMEFIFACVLIALLVLQECICEHRGERLREKFLSSPAWVRVLCAAAVLLIIVFLGRYGIGNESKFIYFQF
jgi:D-alanyl-lipoteichoic acid acyltransferase DltB (MBOAT superfamily)